MAAKSTYLDNKLLDAVLRNVAYTLPSTVYLALFTVTPTVAGGGTEVTGNAYARQSLTFGAASAGACVTTVDAFFPVATPAGWGSIVAVGVFDALTAGNMLYFTSTGPVTINASDQLKFAAGQVTIGES
jgi:hypothetical protein